MSKSCHKEKLFCYVDETGQDTLGQLFIVSVVVLAEDRDRLRRDLEQIEGDSGKIQRKWTRSTPRQREGYMQSVLKHPGLAGKLHYSIYPQGGRAYVELTILATAKAINSSSRENQPATIFRQLRVKVHKVRGMKDQNDVFIRLADSLAGFVRDGLTGDEHFKKLYADAVAARKIQES